MKLSDAQNIYHQLLLNHGSQRHTLDYQKALCNIRDEISEMTGKGNQEVQEAAEELMYKAMYCKDEQ